MFTPVDRDLTPVLPLCFRSLFLVLAVLFGLAVFAAVQVSMTLGDLRVLGLEGALRDAWVLAAGDRLLVVLLAAAGSVVLVRGGSLRLGMLVSLLLVVLALLAPLGACWFPGCLQGALAVLVVVPLLVLPVMMRCGHPGSGLRRLTMGVALALLLSVLLVLLEWGLLVLFGWMMGAWRAWVALVLALPVVVWLLVRVLRGSLPGVGLLEDAVGSGAAGCAAGGSGDGRVFGPALCRVFWGGVLLALAVVVCGRVKDDVLMGVCGWGAAVALGVFLLGWGRDVLLVLREWRFWVVLVLLPGGFLLDGSGVSGMVADPGRQLLAVGLLLLGCLAAAGLMRVWRPAWVALGSVVLLLLLYGACLVLMVGAACVARGVEVPLLEGVSTGVLTGVFGLARVVGAAVFCALLVFVLERFSQRQGGMVCGLLCAGSGVLSWGVDVLLQCLL